MILLPQKVAYRGTLTDLRISAVDGTAFLDNCAALVPYADGSHLVEIYDASGRMLRGYLGAAGTGETLASTGGPLNDGEILADPAFDTTDGSVWTAQAGWSVTGGKAVAESTTLSLWQSQILAVGSLVKGVLVCDSYTSGNWRTRYSLNTYSQYYASSGTKTDYVTIIDSGIRGISGGTVPLSATFTSISMKLVTAPSTTGCTIVSAKGGATANWAYKDAAFTYNAATNYVVVRKAR